MKKVTTVDKPLKRHLLEKRNEFIWSLTDQDYNSSEIAALFNMDRSYVFKIIKKRPPGWTNPWFRIDKIK